MRPAQVGPLLVFAPFLPVPLIRSAPRVSGINICFAAKAKRRKRKHFSKRKTIVRAFLFRPSLLFFLLPFVYVGVEFMSLLAKIIYARLLSCLCAMKNNSITFQVFFTYSREDFPLLSPPPPPKKKIIGQVCQSRRPLNYPGKKLLIFSNSFLVKNTNTISCFVINFSNCSNFNAVFLFRTHKKNF